MQMSLPTPRENHRVATEQELKAIRAAQARRFEEHGASAFPAWSASEELERNRRDFVLTAQDPQRCAELPLESDIQPNAPVVLLYGRVMARRGPFLVLRTSHGDAQALLRSDHLPATAQALFAEVDLADHVAVRGHAMRTRTGAAALRATDLVHLSKALLPPPEKWHGLKDVEKRYRERYVDLFANPEVADIFRARSLIVRELRQALHERGFLEVETPLLHPVRGGALARPFGTHHNALDLSLYLRIAPELYLKRLLVGGLDRVFEIGRAFRNEGISTRHNPEFTILEAYQAYATFEQLMDSVEALLRRVDASLCQQFPRFATGRSFCLSEPWKRVSMRQSLIDRGQRASILGIKTTPWEGALQADVVMNGERLALVCKAIVAGLPEETQKSWAKTESYGACVFRLFEQLVEPELPRLYRNADATASLPTFITEYPAEESPLARRSDVDPAWVDRYELFVEGRELANAFTELNDPRDQAERFNEQLRQRSSGDDEAMDFDADYIRALEHGMPPAAGFGIGVDRLVMSLCNQASIRDVLLFPLLRPESV